MGEGVLLKKVLVCTRGGVVIKKRVRTRFDYLSQQLIQKLDLFYQKAMSFSNLKNRYFVFF